MPGVRVRICVQLTSFFKGIRFGYIEVSVNDNLEQPSSLSYYIIFVILCLFETRPLTFRTLLPFSKVILLSENFVSY